MYISKIHVTAFGSIADYDVDLAPGVNIFEGDNESGKSTLAMFIKFILYGSGTAKAKDNSAVSDRKKFISWNLGSASGYITIETADDSYRIERSLSVSTGPNGRDLYRETVKMINPSTNAVLFKGEVPGEVLFGVPEDMFMNTAFVRQTDNSGKKPDSTASSAIENIMFAADESINIKKALEKLDLARRTLMHKNGGGGEIFELERKNAVLAKYLSETQNESAEILAIEGTLSDFAAKSVDIERKFEKNDKLCAVWDITRRLKKNESLRLLEKKYRERMADAERLASKYKSSGFIPDREFQKELRDTARDLDSLENELREIRDDHILSRDNTKSFSSEITAPADFGENEEQQILDDAYTHRMRKRAFLGVSIVLIIMGVVSALSVAVGKIFFEQFIYFGVISAVLFFAAALLCMKLWADERGELNSIFSEWGVQTIAELEDTLEREAFISEETHTDEIDYGADDTYEAVPVLNERCEYAFTLLERIGRTERSEYIFRSNNADAYAYSKYDTKMLIDAIRKAETEIADFCDLYAEITRDIDMLSEKIASARELEPGEIIPGSDAELQSKLRLLLADDDIAGSVPDAETIASVRRERDFSAKAIDALVTRTHELEKRLAALKATVKEEPAQIANRIESNRKILDEMKKNCDAYQLAYNILSEAGDGLRGSVAPRLTDYACRLMAGLSGSRYGTITDGGEGKSGGISIDAKLDMTFDSEGSTREIDYLSAGTKDIAYVSLRLALAELIYEKEKPPLIFDESFARLDETRLTRMLKLLSSASLSKRQSIDEGYQIIIFTCHTREAALLPSAKIIRL